MAISYDAVSSDVSSGESTIDWSHTIGSGSNRFLLVCIGAEDWGSPNVTDVTYDNVSLTEAITEVEGANYVWVWYMPEADLPSTGAHTIEVTFNETTLTACGAISLEDVKQEAPEASNSSTDTNTDTITTTITTITDGAWLVDMVGCSGGATFTAGSGQAERFDIVASADTTSAGSTKPVVSAGGTSAQQTADGSHGRLVHCVIAVAPEAVAPSFIPKVIMIN